MGIISRTIFGILCNLIMCQGVYEAIDTVMVCVRDPICTAGHDLRDNCVNCDFEKIMVSSMN